MAQGSYLREYCFGALLNLSMATLNRTAGMHVSGVSLCMCTLIERYNLPV